MGWNMEYDDIVGLGGALVSSKCTLAKEGHYDRDWLWNILPELRSNRQRERIMAYPLLLRATSQQGGPRKGEERSIGPVGLPQLFSTLPSLNPLRTGLVGPKVKV